MLGRAIRWWEDRRTKPQVPAEDRFEEDRGVVLGEVYAYRLWRVRDDRLRSLIVPTLWPPYDPLVSAPVAYPDYAAAGHPITLGGTDPRYGIHASKTEAMAIVWLSQYLYVHQQGGLSIPSVVFGRVKLWGQIYEHFDGYRAEFARPYALDVIVDDMRLSRGDNAALMRLRHIYQTTEV